MLCQRCKKNQATVSLTEIINGVEYHTNLCTSCYAEQFADFGINTDQDMWPGLFAPTGKHTKRCPVCGTSFAEYERTGLLGCPSCYDCFRAELTPVIARIQRSTSHVGKQEEKKEEPETEESRIERLQAELDRAISDRDFKKAGEINDEIERLQGKDNGSKGEGDE